jgi:hypothetical protein
VRLEIGNVTVRDEVFGPEAALRESDGLELHR